MIAETQERRKLRPRIALPDELKSAYRRLLVPVCAMVAAGLGIAALLGWVLDLPFLASFGQEKTPMSPSTAMLLALYGVTIFLRFRLPHRGVYWTGLSVHATGALIALLLVILFYQGIHPEAEHLGLSIPHAPGLKPVGHMSPVTALCFLLASLSFLASLPASPARPWRAFAAMLPACLLLAISSLLALASLFSIPLLYQGSLISPSLPSCLAFVALGTALLALALPQVRQSLGQAELATRFPYDFIVIFIILTMGILTAGNIFYRGYERRCRIELERQLSAVAELKKAELMKWRGERMGDAGIIYKNTVFSALVSRYFNNQEDSEAEPQLREWLGQYQKNCEYDQVRLLDREGVTRMLFPADRPPASAAVLNGMAEVLQTGRITIVDLYRHDYDQRIYLSVLIPILDASAENRVIGIFSLRVDPEKYLFPFILRWPTPSQTAETLLVRREGDEVLFLNNLKFRKEAALKHRVSLERTNAPPVMAVLGRTGIVEGLAYRGEVPVIADVRPVPDSPWFLVVRMNFSEVYAPAIEYLWMIVGLMAALIFGAGAGLACGWWQQNLGFYRERLAAAEVLRKSEKKLSVLHRIAKIFLLVPDEEMYGQVLEVMLEITGSQYGVFRYLDEEGALVAPSMTRDIWEQCRIPQKSIRFPRETRGDNLWSRAILEKRSLIKNAPGRVPEGHVPIANALEVPILFHGEVIGLFELANRPGGYGQAEQDQVEELCSHVAPVLNSRLNRDRQEAARQRSDEALLLSRNQMEAIAQIGAMANSTLDISEVLSNILTGTLKATGASVGMIFLSDHETGCLQWGASHGLSEAFVEAFKDQVIKPGEGLTGIIAQTGEPIYIPEDSSHDPRIFRPVIKAEGLNSFIGVPVYAENKIVAVMNILTRPPDVLREKGIVLIKAVSTHVGSAIRNAQLFKERKCAEEALRNSVLYTRSLIEVSLDPLVTISLDGMLMDVNTATEDITGVSKDKLIGSDFSKYFTEPEKALTGYRQVLSQGLVTNYPLTVRHSSGRLIDVLNNAILYRNEQGDIAGIFAAARDISERKQAAEALKKSEELYRTLVENIPDYVMRYDRQHRHIFTNSITLRANNMAAEEFLGKTHREMGFDPNLCDRWEKAINKVFETGQPQVEMFEWENAFGVKESFEWRAFPELASNGNIETVLGLSRDITERKQAEEQIRRSLAEKEVMLKEIHHRVKNNMQVIISLLSLQADEIGDDAVRAMFEESRNRINSMALVHDKLYRSEDLAHIDFEEYLQCLMAEIAITYNRSEVGFSVDMDSVAVDVTAGIPCGLIVNELVSNSLKHAFPENRKGTIQVGLKRTEDGGYVLIVSDNGIGFPANVDFRNTASLGLRLVNALTRQLRGTIELSRSEEGTRFSITFPCKNDNQG